MVRFRYHKSEMSMNKASFSEAEAFLAVVDRGGFGAAARELGITQSTVSRRIAALETRIGKRLVERTTRRVALTEAGLAFANDLRDVLPRLADRAYDLVFVDHDPSEYVAVTAAAERLLRPGGTLVLAGALGGGRVSDPTIRDSETVLLREAVKALRDSDAWVPAILPLGEGLLVAARAQ